MSSQMTEKNTACAGTIQLNRLGDCPVKAVEEMQKTEEQRLTLTLRVISFAEPLS